MLLTSNQGFVHRYIYLPTVFSFTTNHIYYQELCRTRPVKGFSLSRQLEDSYSDVYSLGVMIAHMCKLSDLYVEDAMTDAMVDKGTWDPSNGEILLSSYYSPQLKELIRRCQSASQLERPRIYELCLETKSGMEAFRDRAYQEDQDSSTSNIAGVAIYHNKVLYTRDERRLFDENPEFQEAYEASNTNPVKEAEAIEGLGGSKEAKIKLKRWLMTKDDTIKPQLRWYDENFFDEVLDGDSVPSSSEGSTPSPIDDEELETSEGSTSSSSDEAEEE